MAFPREIEILRIPAEGDLHTVTVKLGRALDNGSQNVDRDTVDQEAWLGHVPDLSVYHDTINLDYRRLLDCDRRYYMYKCGGTSVTLPKNQYFKDIKPGPLYGDVFVFKVSGFTKIRGLWKAVFVDIEPFALSFCERGFAYDIARDMAKR
ncbi:MAG: hypothetical protein ASARMPREDX12_007480 [Alectoria sarmentosa]|nr:MAG: hypothetical protein ASARMPREDX12_007480 [Alectoria sarmentosa]